MAFDSIISTEHLGTAAVRAANDFEGPSFNNIAEELQLLIFEKLLQHGTGHDFCTALLVCKQWNRLATPLLWRNISINNSRILFFLKSLASARQSSCDPIRNLSIYIRPTPNRNFYSDRPLPRTILGVPLGELLIGNAQDAYLIAVPDYLHETENFIACERIDNDTSEWKLLEIAMRTLALIIREKIRSLKTFSLRLAIRMDPADRSRANVFQTLAFPRSVLAKFLTSLPDSCVNVEIDDSGRSAGPPFTSDEHICPSVRDILPHLRHLQLKICDICPIVVDHNIAGDPFDNIGNEVPMWKDLKTVHLNLRPSPLAESLRTKACRRLLWNSETPQLNGQEARLWLENEATLHQNALAKSLRSAVDKGSFPGVQSLMLNNRHHNSAIDEWHFTNIDILNERVRLLPDVLIETDAMGTAEQRTTRIHEDCVTLEDGKSLFCTGDESEKIIEALVDDGWFTTTYGLRFPKPFRETVEFKSMRLTCIDPRDLVATETGLYERIGAIQPAGLVFDARQLIDDGLQGLRERRARVYEGLSEEATT
ncbi:hypothetical protein BDV96DRAFT_587913 [Lophiotrema nucula]|uniref:F-box domain-containing protein n=1 Tax=Lophiotrema nucula TaxID=690887 RepID=A0A6A5YQ10_9PLEO|nr:hypothetical protein BDV96DRAFT_587913 [Lophiotrema nucula]